MTRDVFRAPVYDVRPFIRATSTGVADRAKTAFRPNSGLFDENMRLAFRLEAARGFDVLHLDQTWAGWLGRNYEKKALLHILSMCELDSIGTPNGLVSRLRNKLMLRAERSLIRAYKMISTLTPRLTTRVRQLNPDSKVSTVPLGVDLSLYEFKNVASVNPAPVIGLIGSFRWGPTYSAAERLITTLWPKIKARVPSARLMVVGYNALCVASLVTTPDVTIHDDVPDVLPFFRAIDVMLYAPRYGSGMKVKVLEAFAMGTSVVTTSDGVEGLPAEDGRHAGVCDDDSGLIDRAVLLLTNATVRMAQRGEARRLVEQYCSPESTVGAIERIYCEIASK
jgi:glycosyltransferase involved in cell wall biosynthesis